LRDQLGQLRRAYTHWITAALGDRGRMEEAEDKAERLRAELQEKTDWLAKIERALDGWQTRVRGTPPVGGNAMDRIRVLTAAWRGEREQHSAEADTLRAQLEAYKRSLAVIAEAAKNLDEEPTPDETPGLVQCAARESEKCSPRGEPGCDHYEPHKLRDDCAGEASFCPTHGNNVKCSPVKEPAKTIQTTVRCFRHSDAELGIHRRGVWLMTRGSGPRGTFFYGDRNVSEAPAWDVEELAEMAADPNGSGMRVEEILPAEAIKELTSWPEGQEEARRIFARHPKTKPPPSDHGKDASRLCEPMLARSGG
ncbi:MAG: hypothetical protein HQ582_04130, partial [Planctomycetes bacterium]|nr:hypothetical protein [Planctomycetota bacterium]